MQYAPSRSLSWSRYKNLEIRPHHTLYSADSGVTVHLIHGEAPRPQGLAQRLQSHVQTDFVAVLEGIRDGLCDAVHAHRLALDAVSLDAFSQCIATEPHNMEARIGQRWTAAATVERDPNFMRKLSADLGEGIGPILDVLAAPTLQGRNFATLNAPPPRR